MDGNEQHYAQRQRRRKRRKQGGRGRGREKGEEEEEEGNTKKILLNMEPKLNVGRK